MDDLKKYFRGEHWRPTAVTEMSFEAESPTYEVKLKASGFMYHVHVEAADDPSDSEDKVTDEPVKAIVEFLGTGTTGDEYLKKMSSDPSAMAAALKSLAAAVDADEVGPRRLRFILRRIAVAPDMPLMRSVVAACTRVAAGEQLQEEELADLMKSMKSKGWRVDQGTDDRGLPKLTVDVSGIYAADISVENITWNYSFMVRDKPETKEDGVTDDPIVQFRKYYRDPEIQSAKEVRQRETSETQLAPVSGHEKTEAPEPATKPPAREPPPESGETVKPGKKPPEEEGTVKPGRK